MVKDITSGVPEEEKISRLIRNFQGNNINACYFSSGHEAGSRILSLIPRDALVAFGGSTKWVAS